MLFDPASEPRTLPHLIRWLEKQSPRQAYNYSDPCNCLAGRYNAHIGRQYLPSQWANSDLFNRQIETIAMGERYSPTGAHTYGAALTRARKLHAMA